MRRPELPPMRAEDAGKATLILDMDETLISTCDSRRCSSTIDLYDFQVCIKHSETYTEKLAVRKRPGLDLFLNEMAACYELVIFSFSPRATVDAIMDKIDPGQQLVAYILSQDSCPRGLKDLNSPNFGRNLKRVIWLDDNPMSYRDNADQGIVVACFNVESMLSRGRDPSKDTQLFDLMPFLKKIAHVDDVRDSLDSYIKLSGSSKLTTMFMSSISKLKNLLQGPAAFIKGSAAFC